MNNVDSVKYGVSPKDQKADNEALFHYLISLTDSEIRKWIDNATAAQHWYFQSVFDELDTVGKNRTKSKISLQNNFKQ